MARPVAEEPVGPSPVELSPPQPEPPAQADPFAEEPEQAAEEPAFEVAPAEAEVSPEGELAVAQPELDVTPVEPEPEPEERAPADAEPEPAVDEAEPAGEEPEPEGPPDQLGDERLAAASEAGVERPRWRFWRRPAAPETGAAEEAAAPQHVRIVDIEPVVLPEEVDVPWESERDDEPALPWGVVEEPPDAGQPDDEAPEDRGREPAWPSSPAPLRRRGRR
jgi:hypothetical protein